MKNQDQIEEIKKELVRIFKPLFFKVVYFLGLFSKQVRIESYESGKSMWGLRQYIKDNPIPKVVNGLGFSLKDFEKLYMTREQLDKEIIKRRARAELRTMKAIYLKTYPSGNVPFLTGSSLMGNKQGDSARYWELIKIIEE